MPIKNFRLERNIQNGNIGKLELGFLEICGIFIKIVSKEEGPFSFELKSIEFIYDEDYIIEYKKYLLPIFLKV